MKQSIQRAFGRLFGTSLLIVVIISSTYVLPITQRASGLPLSSRSISVLDVNPGAVTQHAFRFSFGSSDPIGSIKFEYCTSPLPEIPCATPAGLSATSATLSAQTGEDNFTILSTQTNAIVLTRTPSAPTQSPSEYVFNGITNPTSAASFYVRMSTYQSIDASGAQTDSGSVVAAISSGVHINTKVPPYLKFCVALVLAADCESTNDDNLIDLGDLSTSRASRGSSQMIAATNADFGLAIAAYGTTMTSGNNIIPALTTPTVSAPGNAQFGLNLRNNSDPDIGEDPSGGGVAMPTAAYNIPNRYVFNSGDIVATSPAVTDTRKFTSSYIVNVSSSQPPGVYTATLTYICTATF